MAPTPSMRKVPEPVCVERAFPPHEVAPKLGLDETIELLTRVLGASEEDQDLSALFAALKTKLGLSDLKKPPPYHVAWSRTADHGREELQRHLQLSYGHLS